MKSNSTQRDALRTPRGIARASSAGYLLSSVCYSMEKCKNRSANVSRVARLVFILAALAFASCSSFPVAQTGRDTLWRVSGDHNSVYLLGSIHVLPRTAYPLRPALQKAFDDAQRLVFEVDLDKFSAETLRQEFQRTGFYPPSDSLSQHLSREANRFLALILPAFGSSLDRVQRFKPWFLAEVLSSRYLQMAGYRDDLGVDMYFYKKAKAAGKPVLGLETIRDQAEIFESFNDQEGEAYLISTIASLPAYSKVVGRMVGAWENGRVNELDRLLNEHAQKEPITYAMMFSKRNGKWLPQIERFVKGGANYLVIVGAGHLVGEQGLIRTLQRAGYHVEQL